MPARPRRSPPKRPLPDLPSLDEVFQVHVEHVLAVCGGNRNAAAVILRIDRKTLYRMLRRWARARRAAE